MITLPITCNQLGYITMGILFVVMIWGANEVWYVQYKMLDGNWIYTVSALVSGAILAGFVLLKTTLWISDNIKCRCDK